MTNAKQLCAICVDHAAGDTERVNLGYGIGIWLCAAHASVEFQTRRGGREFVDVLAQLWTAHGCWNLARRKALDAHLRTVDATREPRQRPGSYAWADLRGKAEAAFARGVHPDAIHAYLEDHLQPGLANVPSLRTLHRWRAERRWLGAG